MFIGLLIEIYGRNSNWIWFFLLYSAICIVVIIYIFKGLKAIKRVEIQNNQFVYNKVILTKKEIEKVHVHNRFIEVQRKSGWFLNKMIRFRLINQEQKKQFLNELEQFCSENNVEIRYESF